MKVRELEERLQELEDFDEPSVMLEQYPTTPHLAAHMMTNIDAVFNDLKDKFIVDLGVGCGMLSVAASLSGASHVLGVDIDPSAIEQAVANCDIFEETSNIDFVIGDVQERGWIKPGFKCDVVVTNPPFGTKRQGADVAFLETAIQIASHAVYSIHKSSTREVMAQMKFELPATHAWHKKEKYVVKVDLIRLDTSGNVTSAGDRERIQTRGKSSSGKGRGGGRSRSRR